MSASLTEPVRVSQLCEALGRRFAGDDCAISHVSPLADARAGALVFSKSAGLLPEGAGPFAVIARGDTRPAGYTVIESENPRLDFARALAWLETAGKFRHPLPEAKVHPTAIVGRNTVVGRGVVIGAHVRLGHNVVIGDRVTIGDHSVVKSCAVVGEDGFGFERDEEGMPIRLPHLGTVRIGAHVEIGSLTTVCRGTMGDTILEDHVKVDDHVHIAHNCHIKRGAMVIACAEVSGSAVIGERAWIAPNASLLQKVHIGADAVVGLGAVVIKSVEPGATVVGNPAKPLRRSE